MVALLKHKDVRVEVQKFGVDVWPSSFVDVVQVNASLDNFVTQMICLL